MTRANEEEVYTFLKARYKHDRFEGRNGNWCKDYSHIVTRSRVEELEHNGLTNISRHESATGNAIWFDANLTIITDEEDIRERLHRTRSVPALPEHGRRQPLGSFPVVS